MGTVSRLSCNAPGNAAESASDRRRLVILEDECENVIDL